MTTARTIWLDRSQLYPTVSSQLHRGEIVLDIGCGIRPEAHVRPLVHICVEPFEQYVRVLQAKAAREADRTFVILKAKWSELLELMPERSVDCIYLIDVVEHLEKQEALDLLRRTVPLARRQCVLFTPLGFMPQSHPDGKDIWGLDGGAWQEHKSGWQPEDFQPPWRVYAAKVYHEVDNMGRKFETPFGALWAILDVEPQPRKPWTRASADGARRGVGLLASYFSRAARFVRRARGSVAPEDVW